MYSFGLPILEYAAMNDKQVCPACDVVMLRLESKETFPYFVGDECVQVEAHVPKWECGRCGKIHDPDGRMLRNEALKRTLEMYWREKFKGIITQDKVNEIKAICRKVVNEKFKSSKKRRVSEEFGRWLMDCIFG